MEQLRLPDPLTRGLTADAPGRAVQAIRPVIHVLRAQGLGWGAIADRFNVHGVATPSGRGRWYRETVWRTANPERHAAYMRDYRARQRAR